MADKEINLTLKVDAKELNSANKTIDESTKSVTKLEKAQKSYTETLSEEGQEIRNINKSKAQLKKQQDLEAQAANAAKGSFEQLSAQYRLNVIQLNAMGEAERKTSEHGKKLTSETLEIRNAMDAAKKETGDATLSVGGYAEGINQAAGSMGPFGKLLMLHSKAQQAYAKAQAASTAATKTGTTATKMFGMALKATGIGLIVAAIALLVNGFASTQKGMDKVNKALAPLKGAFEAIKGVLQDLALNVFDQLTARWTIAVNSVALGVAKIRLAWNRLTGDTEETEAMMAEVEMRTKAIEGAQKKLNEAARKGGEIWKNSLDRIKEGADTQSRIHDLSIKIEEREIGLNKRKAIANLQLREQQTISKNINLSNEERLKATNETIRLSKFIADQDNEILDMKIEKLKMEQTLNDTQREGAKELSDLEADRIQRDAAQRMMAIKFISRKNALEKAEAKETEKAINEINKNIANYQKELDKELREDDDEYLDAEFEKELAATEAFEKAKQQLKNDLALEAAATEEERELLKTEQDAEKKELELENMILEAEERTELEALLLEQKENTLQEIRDKWTEKKEKAQEDTDKKEIAAKTKMSKIQQGIARALSSALGGILGDSLAGQIAGVAVDAAIQSASVGIKSKAAQASNLAIAASVGPPANLVTIPTAKTQNIGIAASSAKAIGGIWSSAALSAGSSALGKVKFANGGFLNGATHAGGGIDLGFGREGQNMEFLVNDRTMKDPQLRGLVETANAIGNGEGGTINTGVTEERVAEIAAITASSIPVVVVEQDITEVQRVVKVRESEFNG